jgi:hypothetical protein
VIVLPVTQAFTASPTLMPESCGFFAAHVSKFPLFLHLLLLNGDFARLDVDGYHPADRYEAGLAGASFFTSFLASVWPARPISPSPRVCGSAGLAVSAVWPALPASLSLEPGPSRQREAKSAIRSTKLFLHSFHLLSLMGVQKMF